MSVTTASSRLASNRTLSSAQRADQSWIRPPQWLSLPDVTGLEMFAGLHLISRGGNFVAFFAAGNYTVDWGDGTTTNHSSGTKAEKEYNYDNISSAGEDELGYRQVVIKVTPQPGAVLSSVTLPTRHSQVGLNSSYWFLWLDIAINSINLTSFTLGNGIVQYPSLQSVTIGRTALTSYFNLCNNLRALRNIVVADSSAVTSMGQMFRFCTSLTSVPLFNTAAVTNMSSMFESCVSLTSVPLFNTAAVTSMGSMLGECSSLTSVPAMSAAAAVNPSLIASGNNLSWFGMTNLNFSITFANQKLSKAAIDHIFTNLLRRTSSTTITISGNYGADTAISKSSCGTTSGSRTVTQANTASLAVGMRVTGTGVNDAVSVTFQDSGDTVTRASHGLDNGTIVSFSAITGTTGILTYTQYYVVNATVDTFQLAATAGGAAVSLATNGTGTMLYPAYITAITANTSFEMSAPASATGTVTLSARVLDTFPAVAKGWTVSG